MLLVTLGLPVMTTTMVSLNACKVARRMSSPEIWDMYKSTRMMSNLRRLTVSMASSPRPITVTLYPSICSTLAQLSRRVRSSSTTRTRMLALTSLGIDSGSRGGSEFGSPGWSDWESTLAIGAPRDGETLADSGPDAATEMREGNGTVFSSSLDRKVFTTECGRCQAGEGATLQSHGWGSPDRSL